MSRGRFITFEGIEGSGKSTQIDRLAGRLRGSGVAPVVTREPGGTALGRRLRELLLGTRGPVPTAEAELFLYAADRAQHLREVILPALAEGRLVLCDRYADATMAFQAFGRGLPAARVEGLHATPPLDTRPDRTLLLDLDPALALDRARRRNRDRGTAAAEGRFEDEPQAFHRRVREGYLELARNEPQRIRVVKASGSEEEVEERVARELRDLLPEWEPRR